MDYEKFIYLVFFSGVILLFSGHIKATIDAVRSRIIIRRSLRKYRIRPDRKRSQIGRRVEKLLISSGASEYISTPEAFAVLCICLFFGSYITAGLFFGKGLAFFMGLFASSLPYLVIRGWLDRKRVQVSREGDVIVREILSNYRIADRNMKEAIEETARTIENAETGKPVLVNLARSLSNASSEQEVDRALELFRYSFDSAWGNILSTNIFLAVYSGINVESSLTDLSLTMVRSRQVIEEARRANYESKLILRYLFPITYASSAFISVRYFRIPFSKLMKFQFGTETGMRWFMVTLILYVAGIVVMRALSEERMDI